MLRLLRQPGQREARNAGERSQLRPWLLAAAIGETLVSIIDIRQRTCVGPRVRRLICRIVHNNTNPLGGSGIRKELNLMVGNCTCTAHMAMRRMDLRLIRWNMEAQIHAELLRRCRKTLEGGTNPSGFIQGKTWRLRRD